MHLTHNMGIGITSILYMRTFRLREIKSLVPDYTATDSCYLVSIYYILSSCTMLTHINNKNTYIALTTCSKVKVTYIS